MDAFKIFLVVFTFVFATGFSVSGLTENIHQENIRALLTKEKESEAVPPTVLTKEVTFVHKYNDTVKKEDEQNVSSKITSLGGLENKIQNTGGIQKTVLNNKIQYNFYFWLVPKNFTKSAPAKESRPS